MKFLTGFAVFVLSAALSGISSAAVVTVYDGITGATVTFTTALPRTYMGQAFSIADPGVPVEITEMQINLAAADAVNYQNSLIRVQFYETFNTAATGTDLVFSDPKALQQFTTGPIVTAGATGFNFTLPFATPIPFSGLTNHGVVVNWQSDAGGTGTFIDDNNLTAALRTGTSTPITIGSNAGPSGSNYYRNASGLTTLNLQASDTRNIGANGGLVFSLRATAVPEPGCIVLCSVMFCFGLGIRQRTTRPTATSTT